MIFKPLSLSLALRYLLARKTHKFASFVAFISTVGIALGVCALIIVTAVMQGLQDRLKDNLLGLTPHVTVTADSNCDAAALLKLPHVQALSPFVSGQALLQSDNGIALVTVQGEDPAITLSGQSVSSGTKLKDNSFEVLADMSLMLKFNLYPKDKIRLISTQNARYTPLGLTPSSRIFYIKGTLPAQALAGTVPLVTGNYSDIKRLLRISADSVSYRLYLSDPFLVDDTVAKMPAEFSYTTWRDSRGDFFKAVAMEKTTMSLMLFLVIIVAAFNILSALAMMVSARLGDIAVLKTLGMKNLDIMLIFVVTGLGCGFVGTVAGLIAGLALSGNVTEITRFLNISVNAGESKLPVVIDPANITAIAAGALLLSLICTLFPAWKAAAADPTRHLQQGN